MPLLSLSMSMSRVITVLLLVAVAASPREAIVVPVGPKTRLYHPVKCAADAKLGALARGMAHGHNSMETMSTPRQDMLVGALEGFLEDLPSS